MFNPPDSLFCDYTVRCKSCYEVIPAPVETMPDTWIIAACPICGSKYRYLPTDIFRGRLSTKVGSRIIQKAAKGGKRHV